MQKRDSKEQETVFYGPFIPRPCPWAPKRCFRLWDDRFTALSISQHWCLDRDALEGSQECPSEV